MSTSANNYANLGKAMYGSGAATSEYSDMSNSTTNPNAMVNVMNPYDPTYQKFQNAFNQNLLNPHQNDPSIIPRAYYTIDKAYGPPPMASQTKRSCVGGF